MEFKELLKRGSKENSGTKDEQFWIKYYEDIKKFEKEDHPKEEKDLLCGRWGIVHTIIFMLPLWYIEENLVEESNRRQICQSPKKKQKNSEKKDGQR